MLCQKNLFSFPSDIHYLNCAYKAPLLRSSEELCIKALIRERNPAEIQVDDFFNTTECVRGEFSGLINTLPENIAIIPSTSYGFSSALNNIKGREHGRAITVKNEFPSGYFSLERWCKENDNELVIVEPEGGKAYDQNWTEKIISQISDRTSVVLISSVHWMSGQKFDLQSIGEKCEKTGTVFIVDGTQSVGAVPIDVRKCKIDALVCASYKWLLGPYSMAIAFFGNKFANGKPLEEAWINRSNAKLFSSLTNYDPNYRPGAGRFNTGETSNFILTPILKEGLRQINTWKPENIQEYCTRLTQPLFTCLEELNVNIERGEHVSAHLFSLQLPKRMNDELFKKNLDLNNVIISTRGSLIRVSVNVFNDKADVDKLIEVMRSSI